MWRLAQGRCECSQLEPHRPGPESARELLALFVGDVVLNARAYELSWVNDLRRSADHRTSGRTSDVAGRRVPRLVYLDPTRREQQRRSSTEQNWTDLEEDDRGAGSGHRRQYGDCAEHDG